MIDMPKHGMSEDAVLRELRKRLTKDLTHASGRILGSMCAYPHPLARRVYAEFIEKNLGDPGLFPATAELEQEAVQMIGSMLSHQHAFGHIVSGGTEANILALWAARNRRNNDCREILAPASAHLSIEKAADLLSLRVVKVKLDDNFRMDLEDAKQKISDKTWAIVGIAGTTGLGVVDPIAELSEIAVSKDVFLHVDAAFGGFVLPFMRDLGFNVPDFDFRLPGVSSITVDPHKMGLAPIPAGCVVFRDSGMTKAISKRVSYLAGGETEQETLLGTRSGASCIAVWVLLKRLGREGYRNILERSLKLTMKLAEEIEEIEGISLVTKPTLNIIGIKSEQTRVGLLAQELRQRGWAVALFPSYIRIVVMPHIKPEHVQAFLKDLKDTMKKLRGR